MKKQYVFVVFLICFFVWAIIVDNVVIPANSSLRQDVGSYTRYRVKKWSKDGKLNLLKDELLVYAVVKNRERLYYIEYKPHFENTLKNMEPGTSVQLRYATIFPKIWKKNLYDLRVEGLSTLCYSSWQLEKKQREVWKYTGILGGIFLFLAVLGYINKPLWKRRQ